MARTLNLKARYQQRIKKIVLSAIKLEEDYLLPLPVLFSSSIEASVYENFLFATTSGEQKGSLFHMYGDLLFLFDGRESLDDFSLIIGTAGLRYGATVRYSLQNPITESTNNFAALLEDQYYQDLFEVSIIHNPVGAVNFGIYLNRSKQVINEIEASEFQSFSWEPFFDIDTNFFGVWEADSIINSNGNLYFLQSLFDLAHLLLNISDMPYGYKILLPSIGVEFNPSVYFYERPITLNDMQFSMCFSTENILELIPLISPEYPLGVSACLITNSIDKLSGNDTIIQEAIFSADYHFSTKRQDGGAFQLALDVSYLNTAEIPNSHPSVWGYRVKGGLGGSRGLGLTVVVERNYSKTLVSFPQSYSKDRLSFSFSITL